MNFVEACQLAKSGVLKILIIIGQSLDKTTNGRGLNWLCEAHSIQRVIYVNPDLTATDDIVCGKLNGWGLDMSGRHFLSVKATADGFTNELLERMSVKQKHTIRMLLDTEDIRQRWINLELPPRFLIPHHLVGANRIDLREIYDIIVTTAARASSMVIANKSNPIMSARCTHGGALRDSKEKEEKEEDGGGLEAMAVVARRASRRCSLPGSQAKSLHI